MKTRVWSRENQAYLDDDCWLLNGKGEVWYDPFSENRYKLVKGSYIIQKAVGLDDIYGYEIFEGDLVKLFFQHESINSETYELKYIRGQWCLDNENSSPFLFKKGGPRVIVVGNAFENRGVKV